MSTTMYCTYTENDKIIESDFVDVSEVKDWFADSYDHHTGEYPNQDEFNVFLRCESVDYIQDGKIWCSWKMEESN